MSNAVREMRDYQTAIDKLKTLDRLLSAEKRDDTMSKISIGVSRDITIADHGIETVARSIADLIRADLEKYASAAIEIAREDLRQAADKVRDAVTVDLHSITSRR